jgi:nucleotide-binding universal stress UspA family protein
VPAEAAIRVEIGDPAKVVTATAGQMHADLLVIGRACSTGMMGRLREQAYGIVRDSPCPVLSV